MAPLLYKLDASPPACAVRMLADIIGLQLDFKDLDVKAMEHKSADYVKLNPLGTIPVLVDDDFAVADSHAIMIYLLLKYGGDKSDRLYPSDVRMRTAVNQILFFDTGILFIRLKVVALPTVMEGLQGPTARHLADIEEGYGMVEEYLGRHKYMAADHLTIADLSIASTVASLQGILELDGDKYPRTATWLTSLEQEPFYQRTMAPGAALFGKTMQYYWQKNKQP